MSTSEKRIDLPGITHNQPDVYETPDTSTTTETKKYEDDSQSDSVSKLECGVGKSYDAFKGKAVDSQNTDFSDEVRQGFGSLPDFIPKDSDKHETMFERYKRLEQEIADLLTDMEHLKTGGGQQTSDEASDRTENAVSVEELKVLQQQLSTVDPNKMIRDEISPAYGNLLTKDLASKLETSSTSGAADSGPSSDVAIYELYHKPETAKFAQLSKLSQLEERLAQLEAVVGMENPEPSVVSGGLDGEKKCIAAGLASLHAKVALLDQTHVAAADMRLQGLLNSIRQVKKEQSQLQGSDSQSRVSEVYDTMQKWDSIASLLPDLIDRLHTLKDLHQQAADFSNTVTQLGDEQTKMTSELTANRNLLLQLKTTFANNVAAIETNCNNLEARVTALMKK
ncbi:dynactin subunit 2-like [Dysidea avara]|uniref:dynactin subunit 2-like n=1 Tax=Dysidea avara TaxID=196820 RepID=UPI00331F1E53